LWNCRFMFHNHEETDCWTNRRRAEGKFTLSRLKLIGKCNSEVLHL
jgi:hypothetical protein